MKLKLVKKLKKEKFSEALKIIVKKKQQEVEYMSKTEGGGVHVNNGLVNLKFIPCH